jgi:hypothetical protein
MVAMNTNGRYWPATSEPTPLVGRLAEGIRQYLARHPEVSAEEFLLTAVRRELSLREGPTYEDIRLHAWLNERLAALHHERDGLWAKIRRFLFGNRLFRRADR